MSRWNLAMGLFSAGLIVSACSSNSSTTGTGGSGGGAGHAGGSGGTNNGGHAGGGSSGGGTAGGGSTGTAGGTGGSGGSAGGGAAGTAGGGSGGSAGGTGGAAGAAGAGGTNNGGHAGGGSSGGGTAGGGSGGGTGGAAGAAGAGGTNNGGHAGGGSSGGGTAGGSSGGAGGAAGGTVLTTQQMRGQYLVNSVLGCAGCHTPQGGAALSGVDCFVKTAPATGGAGGSGAAGAGGGSGGAGGGGVTPCLSSANLTNDATGIKNLTDQQVKDAFTKGMDPDAAGHYLFATMPYYQFGNLSSVDADAIVAFLRTVPGTSHTVQANTPPYDVQPSAPEWAAVDPTALPAAGTAAGAANGKYLATLACATCHTVTVSSANPLQIDASKAFQGGKLVNTTVNGTAKTVQSSNLTPDTTGIMGWTATQVATAITTAKDNTGATICGMRALANMTTSDATDIGTYLLGIPPVANAITMTCQ